MIFKYGKRFRFASWFNDTPSNTDNNATKPSIPFQSCHDKLSLPGKQIKRLAFYIHYGKYY